MGVFQNVKSKCENVKIQNNSNNYSNKINALANQSGGIRG
jgi:hypothetical protein